MDEQGIELVNRLQALWRRKWAIIIPTLIVIVVTGIVSFLLPRVWELDMIIIPGRFGFETATRQFGEVRAVDPREIVSAINQRAYDRSIAAELKLDMKVMPRLRAENLRETQLIRVWLREEDPPRGTSVLLSLFNIVRGNIDKKVDVEIIRVDTEIRNKEAQIDFLRKKAAITEKKLVMLERRESQIAAEMREAKERVSQIEKDKASALKEEGANDGRALGMLLYSTEIQKSLEYYNTLNELLLEKNLEKVDLEASAKEIAASIEAATNEVKNINEAKMRIERTQMIKEPTTSSNPVSPKKKINVFIAGVLSLAFFTLVALARELLKAKEAAK